VFLLFRDIVPDSATKEERLRTDPYVILTQTVIKPSETEIKHTWNETDFV
jgi:hypothetical protein